MSLANIRTKLTTALTGIGLTVYNKIPDMLAIPCVVISLNEANPVDYDLTARNGFYLYHFQVDVLVSRASVAEAQVDLDRYIDPSDAYSIKKAVEAVDFTPDGQIEWVQKGVAYTEADFRGGKYFGCRFKLEVWSNQN